MCRVDDLFYIAFNMQQLWLMFVDSTSGRLTPPIQSLINTSSITIIIVTTIMLQL
jgi:hypothetical protein